ncbi:MAG: hypothetical protein AABZ30_02235 [Myxococcota bacterium]
MAEKVAKTNIKRDKDFIYYIKGGAVWKTRRKQPGVSKGKAEKITETVTTQDNSYIYFVDKDGDVARAKRAIGGQKRKAAKKSAKKKPARKAAKASKKAKGGKKKSRR